MPKKPSLKKLKIKKPKFKKPTRQSLKSGFKSTVKSVKLWTIVAFLLGVAGFSYSSKYYYENIFTDNEKVFYGMIDKSLNVTNYVREVNQSSSIQSEKQRLLVNFTPEPYVFMETDLEQNQNRILSSVKTQNIGTRDSDYISYKEINIPGADGHLQDYSSALDVWAKRNSAETQTGDAQFLNEAIFTFIPFGNFSESQRSEILTKLKDEGVYKLHSFDMEYKDYRPIMNGQAMMNPRKYISLMKSYAEQSNIGNLDQLDPENYPDKNTFNIVFKIDMLSGRLMQINYPTDGRIETYEAYNVDKPVEIPQNYIGIDELQQRLQQQSQAQSQS